MRSGPAAVSCEYVPVLLAFRSGGSRREDWGWLDRLTPLRARVATRAPVAEGAAVELNFTLAGTPLRNLLSRADGVGTEGDGGRWLELAVQRREDMVLLRRAIERLTSSLASS